MADDKSSVTLLVSKIVRDGNIQAHAVRPGMWFLCGAQAAGRPQGNKWTIVKIERYVTQFRAAMKPNARRSNHHRQDPTH